MRIAVIGGGATGTIVLRELSEALAGPGGFSVSQISIVDASGFDGGVAYRTRHERHLLNMRAATMSAVAGDAAHFLRWLHARGHDVDTGDHPPRSIYRTYLAELLEEANAHCEALGVPVRRVRREAVGLARITPDGYRIELAGGGSLACDAVILCTGHGTPEDHYGLRGRRKFSADPYGALDVADEAGVRIGIIGTGLTAVDKALELGQDLRHARITCLSRSGRFPKVQPHAPAPMDRRFRAAVAAYVAGGDTIRAEGLACRIETALFDAARIALDLASPGSAPNGAAQLEADVAEAERGGANVYSYLAMVTDLVCEAWRGMGHGERSHFMRTVYSGWMRNRHAMPLVNGRKLRDLVRSGRLDVASGVSAIEPAGDGFEARFTEGSAARFDVLISAVGPSYCVADSRLYTEAARNGVLRIDPFGGVVCAHPDGRVLGPDGHPQPHLFAVGSPTRGSFFYAAAMDINVTRTRLMTEALLRDAATRRSPFTPSLEPIVLEG